MYYMSWSHVKSIQPMIESFIPHWNLNGIHSLKHPVTVGPTDKSKPKRKINWLVDWLNIGKNKSWNLNRMYPVHENWRSGSGIWVWMYVVLIANQHLATLEWLWTYLSLSLSRGLDHFLIHNNNVLGEMQNKWERNAISFTCVNAERRTWYIGTIITGDGIWYVFGIELTFLIEAMWE